MLKTWAKTNCSDLQKRVLITKQELKEVLINLQANPLDQGLRDKERICNEAYTIMARMEIAELKQKAECDWLVFGDSCTAYFHKAMRQRKNRSKIWKIKDKNENICEGRDNVAGAFIQYFESAIGSNDFVPDKDKYPSKDKYQLPSSLSLISPSPLRR